MFNKKITRKEFLKQVFFGGLTFLFLPILKMFTVKGKASHMEARYYRNLAG